MFKSFHQCTNPLLGKTNSLGSGFAAALGCYVRAGTMSDFEQSLVLQFRIRFGYSGMADNDLRRERANTR